MSQYEGIVEVAKTNTFGANIALAAGWRLLDVVPECEARLGRKSPGVVGGGNFWVEKWTAYVVGRTALTPPLDRALPRVGMKARVQSIVVVEQAEESTEQTAVDETAAAEPVEV